MLEVNAIFIIWFNYIAELSQICTQSDMQACLCPQEDAFLVGLHMKFDMGYNFTDKLDSSLVRVSRRNHSG